MSISVVGAGEVAAGMTAAATLVRTAEGGLLRRHGHTLLTRVRANASGRPGPRAITGDYRRSWNLSYALTGSGPAVVVGTNSPQGRRLEFGFVGADALGRYFDQPPFPHVGPACDVVEPAFHRDVEALVRSL